jgi:hypothetical protein
MLRIADIRERRPLQAAEQGFVKWSKGNRPLTTSMPCRARPFADARKRPRAAETHPCEYAADRHGTPHWVQERIKTSPEKRRHSRLAEQRRGAGEPELDHRP